MKISHRIAAERKSPFWATIEELGLEIQRDDVCVLNISEDHQDWPEVERLLARHGVDDPLVHFVTNLFTRREIESAERLVASAKGHHGYPQPEDDYVDRTYDVADYCPTCGIGGRQKAPFRLRGEPKARRSQFLQLNWVFDELFVRPEARNALLEAAISGIDYESPVLHRRDQPSEQIAQMRIQSIAPPGLIHEGLFRVTCKPENEEAVQSRPNREPRNQPYCGRIKYHRMRRGPFVFSREVFEEMPDVAKSQEWFGSGASAHRLILVSQRFRRVVGLLGLRGLEFEPVELV